MGAVTRRTQHGNVRGAGQAVSLEQALRAETIEAAGMLRKDHEGSLVSGKEADFAVPSNDPFAGNLQRSRISPFLVLSLKGSSTTSADLIADPYAEDSTAIARPGRV